MDCPIVDKYGDIVCLLVVVMVVDEFVVVRKSRVVDTFPVPTLLSTFKVEFDVLVSSKAPLSTEDDDDDDDASITRNDGDDVDAVIELLPLVVVALNDDTIGRNQSGPFNDNVAAA